MEAIAPTSHSKDSPLWRQRALLFVISGMALIALAFIWQALQERRHDGVREVFANETRRITTKIDERMAAYGQVLRSGAGFFAGSDKVERNEWAAFVEKLDLDQSYRGVQGVGFALHIKGKDLPAHLAEMRRSGFPDYVIKPEGEREEYTSIVYLEPFSGRNLRAFGYDMYSDPTRNAAMSQARDIGDVVFSGKVKLLQETKNDVQAGILAYFPVYRNKTITQTVEQRRASIIGWVYSPYRMNDMMTPIVGKELDAIRLEIFDGDRISEDSFLYDSAFSNQVDQMESVQSTMVINKKLELSGRYWILRYTALPGFAATQRFSSPWIEATTVSTIGLLVLGLTAALVSTQRRAQAIAQNLTAALRQSEQRYSALFAESRVPMLLIDPIGGQIMEGNAAAEAFYGYSADQLKSMNISQINTLTPEQIAMEMQLALSGKRTHFDFTHRLADGTVRAVEVHSGSIDLNGRHTLYSIVHDVTKRREVEIEKAQLAQRLANRERHWAALVETTPVGVFETDVNGKCLFVNQVWEEITGLSYAAAQGDGWNKTIHPDDRQKVFEAWTVCTQSGQACKMEFRFLKPDGTIRWVLGQSHSLVSETGAIAGYIGSVTDITERKKLEESMAELNRNFINFLENTGDFVYFKDSHGCYRFCSQTLARITGHTSWRDIIGKHDIEVFPADTARIYYEEEFPILATGEPLLNKVNPYYDEFGKCGWVSASKWALKGDDGQIQGILGISRDITETKVTEERLKLAAAVFHHSREGIVITDPKGIILDVNNAFTEITGYSREDALGRRPSMLSSGRHTVDFFKTMWRDLTDQQTWEGEIWNRHKNGEIFAEQLTISAVTDDSGAVSQYVGIFMDITLRKDQEQLLERMAHFDPLTNLPNRLLFGDRLRQAMVQTKRRLQQIAVLFIDLDGFKSVNDQYGHEAGDVLLINVAHRFKEALREGDTLARIGGDEFIVLLNDLTGYDDVEHMISRLLAAASAPVSYEMHFMRVSASIGIAMFGPDDNFDEDELLRRSDKAMYHAKSSGKNRYCEYSEDQDAGDTG